MSETAPPLPTPPPTPTPTTPLSAPAAPTRSAGQRMLGCFGRFFSALLVIIITVAIALAAIVYGALSMGYTAALPSELNSSQSRVATLQAENIAFASQNVAFQTQISQITRQSGSDREQVDALKEQVSAFSQISGEVSTRLTADSRERATLVADMRSSRDAVTIFATSEAGRAALLTELSRRSERVERFLQRLSDISQDTALDLQSATATISVPLVPTPPPTETATELVPTSTPTPTAAATVAASPTVRVTITPSPRPSSTPEAATPTRKP